MFSFVFSCCFGLLIAHGFPDKIFGRALVFISSGIKLPDFILHLITHLSQPLLMFF